MNTVRQDLVDCASCGEPVNLSEGEHLYKRLLDGKVRWVCESCCPPDRHCHRCHICGNRYECQQPAPCSFEDRYAVCYSPTCIAVWESDESNAPPSPVPDHLQCTGDAETCRVDFCTNHGYEGDADYRAGIAEIEKRNARKRRRH